MQHHFISDTLTTPATANGPERTITIIKANSMTAQNIDEIVLNTGLFSLLTKIASGVGGERTESFMQLIAAEFEDIASGADKFVEEQVAAFSVQPAAPQIVLTDAPDTLSDRHKKGH